MEIDDAPPLLEYVEKLPQRYVGVGLAARLLFVARKCSSSDDASAIARALELVLPVLEAGVNVREYRAAAAELEKVSPGKGSVISSQVDEKGREAAAKLDACTREFEAHATSQLRENQRRAALDAALHLDAMGDYAGALKYYTKARDLSVTAHKIAEVTLSILELSVLSHSWDVVSRTVSRQDILSDLDAPAAGRVHAAFGLMYLAQLDFALAASNLQKIPESIGDSFRPAAIDDLGVAAVLASAASGSRAAMRAMMDTPVAQAAFDTFPAARIVLEGMCSGAYGAALAAVHTLSRVLLLDPYVGPVLKQLQDAIRARAINLYCSPYTIVDVRAVIAALGPASGGGGGAEPSISDAQLQSVEAELTALIMSGALAGRIDAVAHTFRARVMQPRSSAYTALLESAALYESEAHSTLLNASLHRARIRLESPQGERRRRGTGIGVGGTGLAGAVPEANASVAPSQLLQNEMADGAAHDDDDGGSSSAGGSDAESFVGDRASDAALFSSMGGGGGHAGFPDLLLAGGIGALNFQGSDVWVGSSLEMEKLEAAAADAVKLRPPAFQALAIDIFSDAFSS